MTQLDDQFLADVAELPARERVSFLQHVYDELSLSVGTRFSDGLSDARLAEYEAIIDQNEAWVTHWLDAMSLTSLMIRCMPGLHRKSAKAAITMSCLDMRPSNGWSSIAPTMSISWRR